MHPDKLNELLKHVKDGDISVDDAMLKLKALPFTELSHTTIDNHRHHRTGIPEVIYCLHKTDELIIDIVGTMAESNTNILATRMAASTFDKLSKRFPNAAYNAIGKTMHLPSTDFCVDNTYTVAIVSAGTSDQYVVEEAAETIHAMGYRAVKVLDVGVAGIHRLFAKLDVIQNADVIIVVAGMEGALASVVGGLTDKPIIAVPTSVGYGASFGGISALLTMLNACASGITVVNIDNGFGAGVAAVNILRLLKTRR